MAYLLGEVKVPFNYSQEEDNVAQTPLPSVLRTWSFKRAPLRNRSVPEQAMILCRVSDFQKAWKLSQGRAAIAQWSSADLCARHFWNIRKRKPPTYQPLSFWHWNAQITWETNGKANGKQWKIMRNKRKASKLRATRGNLGKHFWNQSLSENGIHSGVHNFWTKAGNRSGRTLFSYPSSHGVALLQLSANTVKKMVCPQDPELYTVLVLKCKEGSTLPALEVYKIGLQHALGKQHVLAAIGAALLSVVYTSHYACHAPHICMLSSNLLVIFQGQGHWKIRAHMALLSMTTRVNPLDRRRAPSMIGSATATLSGEGSQPPCSILSRPPCSVLSVSTGGWTMR